jgi:hypothetical protein
MLGKSNETLPQTKDSFFDDDDENSTSRDPPLISSIRIVTSKPPVYRRQSHSSSSPSPSSCCSDRDVTDVSSLGGDHHQLQEQEQQEQQQQHKNHKRKSNHEQHHPFHLQSMRHVLLGSSAPTSRPPSPANPQQQSNKKHVRIVTDETDTNLHQHHHHHHHHHHQQPYIHGHTKDYRRVRLTSSAINRQKQQQRIERENLVRFIHSLPFFSKHLLCLSSLIEPLAYMFVQTLPFITFYSLFAFHQNKVLLNIQSYIARGMNFNIRYSKKGKTILKIFFFILQLK